MITTAYLIAAIIVLSIVYFGARRFVRAYQKFRGTRVIKCPETGRPAIVEVDAEHAALTSFIGQTDIRLENCWRWPLNKECGQECLLGLNVASPECLVRSVLMKWYRGKKCAFCQRVFGEVEWIDHKPAVLSPASITVDWGEIPFTKVNEVLASYLPVCWSCHIAQTFRREHPDLVVERSFVKQPSCSRSSAIR